MMYLNHSEADKQLILHLSHAAAQGRRRAFIHTVDSDDIVLAQLCGSFLHFYSYSFGLDLVVKRTTTISHSMISVDSLILL